MSESHPQAELAPRDVVSRAVFERMVATEDTSVYLDLSELDRDPHAVFPGISAICVFFGRDIAREPSPVRPGCHSPGGGPPVGQWAQGGGGLIPAVPDRLGRCLMPGLVEGQT